MIDVSTLRSQIRANTGTDYTEDELYKKYGLQAFAQPLPVAPQRQPFRDPSWVHPDAAPQEIDNFLARNPGRDPDILREGYAQFQENIKAGAQGFTKAPIHADILEQLGNERINKPRPWGTAIADTGKAFMSGIHAGVGDAIGYGIETVGEKLDKPGMATIGRDMRRLEQKTGEEWTQSMSKKGREMAQTPLFDGWKPNLNDNFLGSVVMKAAQSGPGIIASIPIAELIIGSLGLGASALLPEVTAALIKGTASPIAKTLMSGIAKQGLYRTLVDKALAFVPSAVGYGAAEGGMAGLQNAAQTRSEIEAKDPNELLKTSSTFKDYVGRFGGDLKAAQKELAKDAAGDVALRTILATGGIGTLTGGGTLAMLSRAGKQTAEKGIFKKILSGAGEEALQETPQSGAETYIQNLANQKYVDQSINPMDGVVSSALEGGVVGGFTGGIMGGASGALQQKQKEPINLANIPSDAQAGVKAMSDDQLSQSAESLRQRKAENPDDEKVSAYSDFVKNELQHRGISVTEPEQADSATARTTDDIVSNIDQVHRQLMPEAIVNDAQDHSDIKAMGLPVELLNAAPEVRRAAIDEAKAFDIEKDTIGNRKKETAQAIAKIRLSPAYQGMSDNQKKINLISSHADTVEALGYGHSDISGLKPSELEDRVSLGVPKGVMVNTDTESGKPTFVDEKTARKTANQWTNAKGKDHPGAYVPVMVDENRWGWMQVTPENKADIAKYKKIETDYKDPILRKEAEKKKNAERLAEITAKIKVDKFNSMKAKEVEAQTKVELAETEDSTGAGLLYQHALDYGFVPKEKQKPGESLIPEKIRPGIDVLLSEVSTSELSKASKNLEDGTTKRGGSGSPQHFQDMNKELTDAGLTALSRSTMTSLINNVHTGAALTPIQTRQWGAVVKTAEWIQNNDPIFTAGEEVTEAEAKGFTVVDKKVTAGEFNLGDKIIAKLPGDEKEDTYTVTDINNKGMVDFQDGVKKSIDIFDPVHVFAEGRKQTGATKETPLQPETIGERLNNQTLETIAENKLPPTKETSLQDENNTPDASGVPEMGTDSAAGGKGLYPIQGGVESTSSPYGKSIKGAKQWKVTSPIKHPSKIFEDGVSNSIEITEQSNGAFGVFYKPKNEFYGRDYKTVEAAHTAATEALKKIDESMQQRTDPVTYDDNGQIIPLSQRFNAKNDDIRYQQPDITATPATDAWNRMALEVLQKAGSVETQFLSDADFDSVLGQYLSGEKMLQRPGRYGNISRMSKDTGKGDITTGKNPDSLSGGVDFSAAPEWRDIAYREPSEESIQRLKKWLKANPTTTVRMYHGTDASIPIGAEGIKPTSRRTAKSIQSRHGVVSLSVYPGMAKTFGEMAYPGKEIAVYAVDIPISRLIPDADQLKNKRMWGGDQNIGGTLADSIAWGHGAQVKGKIDPYEFTRLNDNASAPGQVRDNTRNQQSADTFVSAFYSPMTKKIYVRRSAAKKDTIFHEYTHAAIIQLLADKPQFHQKGLDLAEESPYFAQAVANGYGVDKSGKLVNKKIAIEEALVQAIGEKGAQIQDVALKNRFKMWLQQLFHKVKSAMRKLTGREMTFEEFTESFAWGMREGKYRTGEGGNGLKMQASAWHGSPHAFDKFSTSKIGTGEGAQAFGYGLYFSEKEDVAKGYAKTLGKPSFEALSENENKILPEWVIAQIHNNQKETKLNSINGLLVQFKRRVIETKDEKKASSQPWLIDQMVKNQQQVVDVLKKLKASGNFKSSTGRNLYSVTIHKGKSPSEYAYMDWYKKLTPAVIDKYAGYLEKKGYYDIARNFRKNAKSMDGRELYRELSELYGSDKEASAILLRAGIDGIKYPAGSLSDSNTGDTSNYVVFDDNAVTIEDHLRFHKTAKQDTVQTPTMTITHVPFMSDAKEKILELAEKAGLNQDLKERLTYNLIDSNNPLKVIQGYFNINDENLDAHGIESLRGKKESGRIKEFRREVIQPLIDRMAKHNITFDQLDEYRHAKHAPEANERLELINAKRTLEGFIALKPEGDKTASRLRKEIAEIAQAAKEAKKLIKKYQDILNPDIDDFDTVEVQQEYLVLLNAQKAGSEAEQEYLDDWNYRKKRLAGIPTFEKDVDLVKNPDEVSSEAILKKYKGNAEIESIRKAFAQIDDNRLTILEQSGELSADSTGAMREAYQFYAPLYREGKDGKLSTGRKLGPLGTPIKVRAGSTRKVADISAHTIANYESAISRSLKTETGRTIYNLVKKTATPDKSVWWVEESPKKQAYDKDGNIVEYPDMVEPADGFFVKVDGKRHMIKVNAENPTMVRFLDSLKSAPEQNSLIRGLSSINRVLAAVNTSLSPEFMFTNLVKDLQTAAIHLEDTELKGLQKTVLKQLPASIKGIWNAEHKNSTEGMSKWYRDFEQNGGKVGWSGGYEEIKDISKRLKSELSMAKGENKAKAYAKSAFTLIESANTAIENGVRLSVYKAMVEMGYSRQKAATVASGLTVDFTKKGKQGGTINALYIFANAGIQGNVRMINAMAHSKRVQKIVGGIVAGGFVMNMLGMVMGGDDDDDGMSNYDKLRMADPGVFERNIIIMTGKNSHIKIPMPWGYNAFYNLGHEIGNAVYKTATGETYDAIDGAARILSGFANSFNPLSSATLLQAIVPTVADPLAYIGENKMWHGGPMMPEKNAFDRTPKPDSERYFKSVSAPSKAIANTLNSITGGDAVKPGLIDVSPETIDMWYDMVTGSAGRFVADTLALPLADDIKKVPFVRRFVGGKSEYIDGEIYNDQLTDVLIIKEQIKAGIPVDDPKRKLIPVADSVEKRLRKLRNSRRQIKEKGGDVDAVDSQILAQQKWFIRMYNKQGKGYMGSQSTDEAMGDMEDIYSLQ